MHRRTFLGAAALGAAAPLIAKTSDPGSQWQAAQDVQRQALIRQADFMGTKTGVSGNQGVAVTTHPLATKAAIDAIKEGGNAVDGACAAALMQTVVEPHMTTLSGVFSMLYFEKASGKTYYMNGSNNRPLEHKPFALKDMLSMMGNAQGVAIPGFWGGWQAVQERWGKLSRKRLMAPSIYYADQGFEVHPFLWGEIFAEMEHIGINSQGREIFMPGNAIIGQGEKLYQKRYADLLRRLAEEGNDYFYHGGFAEKFSRIVQQAGGDITPEDFARYEVMWQEPAKGKYRDYDVVASPPPDFGATNVAEVLQILSHADIGKMGPASESPETAYLMFKALDEVWAETLIANHKGNKVPWQQALDLELAAQRYEKILKNPPRNTGDVLKMAGINSQEPGYAAAPPGSNHLTVTDAEGNVATVLHSCMALPWANSLFVDGTSICGSGIHYSSGVPKPGERINARIVPMMLFKQGRPVMACGSPSVSLYENLIQNITNVLDCGMSIEESVNRPRFGGNWGTGGRLIEADMGEKMLQQLIAKPGVDLKKVNPRHWAHGSFEGIAFSGETAFACGDPRRSALAMAV